MEERSTPLVQGSTKSAGCVISQAAARGTQEAGLTQPRAHLLVDLCTSTERYQLSQNTLITAHATTDATKPNEQWTLPVTSPPPTTMRSGRRWMAEGKRPARARLSSISIFASSRRPSTAAATAGAAEQRWCEASNAMSLSRARLCSLLPTDEDICLSVSISSSVAFAHVWRGRRGKIPHLIAPSPLITRH